ncbi:MAG: hypothetical protein WC420_00065 [Candidatus Paceibacterota bacterium]
MINNIKNSLYNFLGIGIFVLVIVAFSLLIIGGAKLFEVLYPFLEGTSSFIWGIVWLLIFLSIVPKFRNFTGNGIVIGTYLGGAIFWLLCFYITYSLWGLLGIFVGVLFMGLGVFFTAILALLFSGQFSPAFYFIFVLVQIYLVRLLGFWIISKYKLKESMHSDIVEKNSIPVETDNMKLLDSNDFEKTENIIHQYGKVLEKVGRETIKKYPAVVYPQSLLPYPKVVIEEALKDGLIYVEDEEMKENIKGCLGSLVAFIDDEEANIRNSKILKLKASIKKHEKN